MPRFVAATDQAGQTDHGAARQALVLCAIGAVISVNLLANALPIHGRTTGQLAARFEERFRPAGYTFGIWSLIYVGLLAYGAYQALPSQRDDPRLRRVLAPFCLSCAANVAWIFAWHYERVAASLCAMFVLLAALVTVDQRLRAYEHVRRPAREFWCVDAPFRVYLAWITVASLANFSTWMEASGRMPMDLSADGWAIGLIGLLTCIAALIGWLRRDTLFLAVVVWALIGIMVRHGLESAISVAALGAILLSAMLLVRSLLWNQAQRAGATLHHAGVTP